MNSSNNFGGNRQSRREADLRMPHMGPGNRRGGPMGARMNVQKPKNAKKTIFRLLKYMGRRKIFLITLLVIMVFVTAFEVVAPAMQGLAIDTLELGEGGIGVDFDALISLLLIMTVIFAVNGMLTLFQKRVAARLSQSTVCALRNDLFKKISSLPIKYIDTHRHGDIMSRMTNDCETVANAISEAVSALMSSILTFVGVLVIMICYSWLMTLVACITIPLTILVSTQLSKHMRKYFVRQQTLLGKMNGQVEEMVVGYKTVVAYGKENDAVSDFEQTSGELCKCAVSAKVWGSIMGPCMNFLGNLQYVLIAIFGGWLAITGGGMTIGGIIALLNYSKKFTRPLNEIANQYSIILTAIAGAERIFEVMDSDDETDLGTNEFDTESVRGAIEFENVDFSYIPEKTVLKNFNLSVKPGQNVAIVGATGSGKTTVVNLLTRFYELDGGRITIDGIDITEIPKKDLRKMIAIVLQDTVLFSDTIRSNIKYGRLDADDEEMKKAAKAAKADMFIDRLPDGYETVLAESGRNLSQGQRQLISIARAVLADPKILILDEATSSVDTRTEMHIQQAMAALMKNRTSLIIAHRLSTIIDADIIVVIKDGHVAEAGDHGELLALGGEYSKLYKNQFAGIAT